MRRLISFLISIALILPIPAVAGDADVIAVESFRENDGTWRFSVTVKHADTGWEHYADRWDVLAPDGRVLDARVLLHPHVEEQPFKRTLGGVNIPEGVPAVTIRAHCSVDGHGGREIAVALEP